MNTDKFQYDKHIWIINNILRITMFKILQLLGMVINEKYDF